ncbi:MAG: rod shape-determining protein MreD [Pseudomonadota bacterium]
MEWGAATRDTKIVSFVAPLLIGVLGAVVLVAPFRFFEGAAPTPLIPLIVVFFWTLYEPPALPAFSVFAIGLAQDLMTGSPVGLWAMGYLIVYAAVLSQRQFLVGRSFAATWVGFISAALLAGAVIWIGVSLIYGAFVGFGPLLLQLAVTALCNPIVARGFAYVQTRLAEEGD